MLVEFSVTNFRSIRDKQTLSMVKGKGHEHEATHTFKPTAPGSETLLKSAAIYGANAAGKSNIIKAISTMRKIVVESAKGQLGDKLPVTPFMFDPETPKQPSEFEIIFIQDNVRYQYGFSTTEERIWSEWLFAYPKGRSQRWFERNYDPETGEYTWHLDTNLKGEKKVWKDSTRDNALFLSIAVQLNSEILKKIYDFFVKMGAGDMTNDAVSLVNFLRFIDVFINKPPSIDLVSKFINSMNVGVDKISLSDEFSPDRYVKPNKAFDDIEVYKKINNTMYKSKMKDESEGTKRVIQLMHGLMIGLHYGSVVLIDEINLKLHPALVKMIITKFHDLEQNPQNGQLIFTTHETSVLDQDIFRRDQIWFCEKDENHATRLYSLLDFKPRKGYENLEAAYLAGRYGAVPVINSL